jgi:hypothetical protein
MSQVLQNLVGISIASMFDAKFLTWVHLMVDGPKVKGSSSAGAAGKGWRLRGRI